MKIGDKIILLRFEKISYLEANDKYVNVFLEDGQKYLTDQTLTTLEEKLPGDFLRVQKSYIINKEKIKEVHKHFNGRFVLTMDDKERNRITTGLTYNEAVKYALGLL
ncbi:MAG: LytTR family transcriptional regulator DNA-binding domain-containing protein [Sphingobacteriales bacterium]|nr:LytTR family transcriptional regulator DNA-binding domain-containing protein [Sphingobacteriales bacterium]